MSSQVAPEFCYLSEEDERREEISIGRILIEAAGLSPVEPVVRDFDLTLATGQAFFELEPRQQQVLRENLGLEGLDIRPLRVIAQNLPKLDGSQEVEVSKTKAGQLRLEALEQIRRLVVSQLGDKQRQELASLLVENLSSRE